MGATDGVQIPPTRLETHPDTLECVVTEFHGYCKDSRGVSLAVSIVVPCSKTPNMSYGKRYIKYSAAGPL
jgi:hypothetical protein